MGKPLAKTQEIWRERLERWRTSKLSKEEFAALEGVKPSALQWWQWRVAGSAPGPAMQPPAKVGRARRSTFVEVGLPTTVAQPAQATGYAVVLCNGRVVRVPADFSDETLRRLLDVAEGAPR